MSLLLEDFFDGLATDELPEKKFYIDTKGKKPRPITTYANQTMVDFQLEFLRRLRGLNLSMPSAYGGVRFRSAIGNVMYHMRKNPSDRTFRVPPYLFLTDISSFYDSVDLDTLAHVLVDISGKVYDIKRIREILCYCEAKHGGLATGLHTSPMLANILCEWLIDRYLRAECAKWSVRYTRFIDDLTFSSNHKIGSTKRRRIRHLVERIGFRLADHKTQIVVPKTQRFVINGIGIERGEPNGKLYLPNKERSTLLGLINRALHGEVSLESKIEGRMGLFLSKTEPNPVKLTNTEKRVLEYYARFRRMVYPNRYSFRWQDKKVVCMPDGSITGCFLDGVELFNFGTT